MERILVIGSPGAGKSTFARALADGLGLPIVHLDAEYWQRGWVEPPADTWRAKVADLARANRWVMDGNYGGSLDLRLARADTVVWLDYPTWLCLARAMRRVLRYSGETRPDMAPGCEERFDLEFIAYIARFRHQKRPGIVRRLEAFAGQMYRLASPADAERLLRARVGPAAPRG